MNYASVFEYFLDSDFDIQPSSHFDSDTLSVYVEIEGHTVTLVHFCVPELQSLPQFFLKDSASFGVLAHVIPSNIDGFGSICVNQLDSVSINFERPELVFEESIKRHIELLKPLIKDTEFNKSELLREFKTNWNINTKSLRSNSPKTLFCSSKKDSYSLLNIYEPLLKDSVMNIHASFSALSDKDYDSDVANFLMIEQRKKQKNAIGCILSLSSVDPCIPKNDNDLKRWLLEAILTLSPEVKTKTDKDFFNIRAKIFWLVLNVDTPSGKAWVGVQLTLDNKRAFPLTFEKISSWKIEPFFVEVFNKELMLPRSGANPSLDRNKVLLFGCGSVGSEVAHKLGASGIGQIDIVDPDRFTTSNLYRHTLDGKMTNWPKAHAVSLQLQAKFPWLKTTPHFTYLLDCRDAAFLSLYDLIIVAIGSPTHERIFHDYLVKSKIKTPIIYSWLEGYGIGGHSLLDIPNKKGCLRCAYVESNTGIRGLSSNLNFLEPNQNIVKNYAGCGEMFIPYGAISSAQTALIAADLAIGYLEGKLVESSKVSWKGDCTDSKQQDLKITPRYLAFSSSLKKQPLIHPLCDICHPEEMLVYRSPSGQNFFLPSTIHQELCTYRQEEQPHLESAGLLIGCYKQNGDILVDSFTRPKTTDQRTRTTFKLDTEAHQLEIEEAYTYSDQLLGYIGTWHTHPQNIPVPSSIDINDWRSHERDNPTRPLFFIVVGLIKTSVYTIENSNVIELTNSRETIN